MASNRFVGVAIALAAGTGHAAETCAAGRKTKATLTSVFCNDAVMNAGNCVACCETDATKCFGVTPNCDSTKFKDPAKYGATAGVTAAAMKTNCCTTKATCGTPTCTAGKKAKASSTQCATATCSDDECCETDTTKCFGVTPDCDGTTFKDPAKYDATAGSGGDMKTNCCTAKATCGTPTCTAGKRAKASSTQCATATCSDDECCETDTTKCFGVTPNCDGTTFKDPAKNGATAGSGGAMKTNCCTAKATCKAFSEKAGNTNSASTTNRASLGGAVMFALVALSFYKF